MLNNLTSASHARALVAGMAAGLLAGVAGCNQHPGVAVVQRQLAALEACHTLLKSITDAESGRAAASKIGPVYTELREALQAVIEFEKVHGGVRGRKEDVERMTRDMARLHAAVAAESTRIGELKGLPAELWSEFRKESARLVLLTIDAGQLAKQGVDPAIIAALRRSLAIYEQHGADRVVGLDLTNPSPESAAAALRRVREVAGADAEVIDVHLPDGSVAVTVAPADFDKLLAGIDFGDTVTPEKPKGEIAVTWTSDVASSPSDAEVEPPAQIGDSPSPASDEARRQARLAWQNYEAEHPTASRAAEAQVGGDRRRPNLGDPDYHEQLAELLLDPEAMHHDFAVGALLRVKPEEIADKELRKKIARGYREAAFNSKFDQDAAIQGLVLWGGKFSVPLLIQLMEREKLGASEAVFDGLSKHPTPEAATAVARQIDNFFSGKEAMQCLRRMGPVAEDALIEVLPAEDAEVNFAAINVLGEIGTNKSYSILRLASRSDDPDIREAAAEATRSIKDREQAGVAP